MPPSADADRALIPSATPTFLQSDRAGARAMQPVVKFLHVEAAGGILLLVATVVALIWANSPWEASYDTLWSTNIHIEVGSYTFEENLGHVVNDLLMALFFFVVGMEIKRELVTGELRDRRAVALPAMAALGGMIVPAVIYLAFNAGGDGIDGWGIPMATDIAFALGVVALLGSRVPPAVKVLLLTLAIVDDIGAILVIAVFYTDKVEFSFLITAAVVAVVVAAMHRFHITYAPLLVLAGFVLWLTVYESGVHATIAGVVMGLLMPARPMHSQLDADEVVHVLEGDDDITAADVRRTAECDRRHRVTLRSLDQCAAPMDELSHRAGLRLGQRGDRHLERCAVVAVVGARRGGGRAGRGQVRRRRPVQLGGRQARIRPPAAGCAVGAHPRDRRRRRHRLHRLVVHRRPGVRRRTAAGRREARHAHRVGRGGDRGCRGAERGRPPNPWFRRRSRVTQSAHGRADPDRHLIQRRVREV